MVLFQIAGLLVKGVSLGIFETIRLFISLTVGGTLLGIFFGFLGSLALRKITNDPILTVSTTFVSCYLVYFVAENVDIGFEVSGIMALVSLSLYMSIFGKTRISSEDLHFVETFWKYVVYASESTIFLIAGMIVSIKVINNSNSYIESQDYIKLLGLYVCMTFCRFLAISCFMPWLKNWGKTISS